MSRRKRNPDEPRKVKVVRKPDLHASVEYWLHNEFVDTDLLPTIQVSVTAQHADAIEALAERLNISQSAVIRAGIQQVLHAFRFADVNSTEHYAMRRVHNATAAKAPKLRTRLEMLDTDYLRVPDMGPYFVAGIALPDWVTAALRVRAEQYKRTSGTGWRVCTGVSPLMHEAVGLLRQHMGLSAVLPDVGFRNYVADMAVQSGSTKADIMRAAIHLYLVQHKIKE